MKVISHLSVILLVLTACSSVCLGQWTATNLSEAKVQMGATSLGSKAYFGGGLGAFNHTKVVDIYDASTGEWTTDELSVARSFHAAVSAGSKVFFAGGLKFDALENLTTVDIFDTLTQSWTVAQLSSPRMYDQAVSYENTVLFTGGYRVLSLSPTNFEFSDIVDIYDLTSETWSTANLSQARSGVAASVVGDVALFGGGQTSTTEVSDRVDIYNFSTGTWTTASLSEARFFCTAVTIGQKVLFAGGTNADNEQSSTVDIYDHSTGEWSTSHLSAARSFTTKAVSACGLAFFPPGAILDLPTFLTTGAVNIVDIYDGINDTWTSYTLSIDKINNATAAVDNQILIAGGTTSSGILTDRVDIYTCEVVNKTDEALLPAQKVKLWPNPFEQKVTISIDERSGAAFRVQLFDLSGRLLYSAAGNGEVSLTLDHLSPGTYLAKILTDEWAAT